MMKSRPSRKTKMTSHQRATQRLHCRTCSPTYPRTTSSSSISSSSARWSCRLNQQTPRTATADQRRQSRPSRTSTKLRSKRRMEQRKTVSAPPRLAITSIMLTPHHRQATEEGVLHSMGVSVRQGGHLSVQRVPARFRCVSHLNDKLRAGLYLELSLSECSSPTKASTSF